MKKIVPLFLATVALSAYSAIATTNAAYKASAGLVERPNSSKGAIVFVDTQSELNPSNITVAIQRLKEISLDILLRLRNLPVTNLSN